METITELEWLSACCGRPYVGELSDPVLPKGSADSYCVGECSRCHDFVTFNLEDPNDMLPNATLTAPQFPGFDDLFKSLVKPFRPKTRTGPWEFKVTALRECPTPMDLQMCDTPDKAAEYWKLHIATEERFKPECESLAVLLLNTRRRVTGHHVVSTGTHDTILISATQVFRLAVCASAAAIVLMHNHPSGDPTPSEADIKVTRDLIRAGQILKLDLLDHVIVGKPNHTSLREMGFWAV